MLHKLKMRFKKPKKVEVLEIIEENCVGCAKCAKMCKREVFSMINGHAEVTNFDACVGCGKCVKKMCNFAAINLILSQNMSKNEN